MYECNQLHKHLGEKTCQSLRGDGIDAAVAAVFLEAMQPAELEVSMAAIDQIAEQARRVDRQWAMIVERARYEAELARRRFLAIDPENRLVGRTLEREWEARLAEVERLEQESATRPDRSIRLVDPAERARILALARDLPALWQRRHDDQCSAKTTDRILDQGCLPQRGETMIEVSIRWQTEACTVLSIPRPPRSCDERRTDAAVLARLRTLAADTTDGRIAEILDHEGFRSGTGQRFTTNIVKQLRYSYSIPSGCPDGPVASAEGYRADGRCSSKVAADMLQVNVSTIAAWCQSGILDGIQSGPHGPWWIKLTPEIDRPLAQADASLLVAAIGLMNQKRAHGGAGPPSLNPQPRWKEVQYERQIGMPSGLCLPSGLGMYTRRTGRGWYVSFLSSSASSSNHRSAP